MRKIKFVFGYVLVAASLLLSGCAELGRIQLIDEDTVVPQRKAVVFFVDGVNHSVFREMLGSGELPNIDRYFVEGGCLVEDAVTAVPSITYAVTTTLATGKLPGRHGVIGNQYFDRDRLVFVDYNTISTYRNLDNDYHAPNIYEILGDKFSVVIQTPLTRGAYHRIDNWATSGACWFIQRFETVDRWTSRRFKLIGEIARRSQRWPGLIFMYFPATDEIGHRYGPDSRRYHESLVNIDRQIGHVCSSLEYSGLLKSTNLIFVSDHGMAGFAKDKYIDLEKMLKDCFNFSIATKGLDQRVSVSRRGKYFRRFDAVLIGGGSCGRCACLYVKKADDWAAAAETEQTEPIADFLAGHPGIGLLAYRCKSGVIVQNIAGRGLIERMEAGAQSKGEKRLPAKKYGIPLNERQYRYLVVDGKDPIGYDDALVDSGLLDGNYHSGQEWLRATVKSNYPDLPVQMAELFESKRCGDIMIFAAGKWHFNPRIVGGHGGVTAVDMKAPLMIAGPGVKRGTRVEAARMVDLAPTVIDMLDSEKLGEYHFDGQSLLP